MDDSRARELLQLALDADGSRGALDPSAAERLRAAADELGPAALHLIRDAPASALRLVAALSGYWQDVGRVELGRRITETVVAAAATERSPEWVDALLALSELAFRQADQATAADLGREAIDVASAIAYPAGASLGWSMLARVAFRDGDGEAMEDAGANALDQAGDHELARRGALHMLAWAAHTRGDIEQARRRFEASLAYRREIHAGPLSEVVEIANIAELDLDAGHVARAAGAIADVLETARALDNRYLVVNTIPIVAAIAAAQGEDQAAAELLGANDALAEAAAIAPDPGSEREGLRDGLKERLAPGAFEAALARGRRSSENAATALAMELCRSVEAGVPFPRQQVIEGPRGP